MSAADEPLSVGPERYHPLVALSLSLVAMTLLDDVGPAVLASSSIPLLTNWLDHIKVRMQTPVSSPTARAYGGTIDTARARARAG